MMPKLAKVKYLHNADLDALNKKVQTRIKSGWELGGPLQFENNEYIQMLMKFTQVSTNPVSISYEPNSKDQESNQ